MRPTEMIIKFVEFYNKKDVEGLTELYHEDAINHRINDEPVYGKESIKAMFEQEFAQVKTVCTVDRIFESKDWGFLEWKDPFGQNSIVLFRVVEGKITFQRRHNNQFPVLQHPKLPISNH